MKKDAVSKECFECAIRAIEKALHSNFKRGESYYRKKQFIKITIFENLEDDTVENYEKLTNDSFILELF